MSAADDSRIYGVGKYTWSGNSVFDGSWEMPPAVIATRLNRLEDTLSKKEQAIAELEARLKEKHFNNLTPAELERIALLSEELGECQQAIGKILRHGYESRHPNGGPTNRQSLERELGDVSHSIDRLCASNDLDKDMINEHRGDKAAVVWKYLHHQGEQE